MKIGVKTISEHTMNLEVHDKEFIALSINNEKVFLSDEDLTELEQSIDHLRRQFQSIFFADLQVQFTKHSSKVIQELPDDVLMDLARFNDRVQPYRKIFTTNVRTELFKRNGLKKAGYKLSQEQTRFLMSHGLKTK